LFICRVAASKGDKPSILRRMIALSPRDAALQRAKANQTAAVAHPKAATIAQATVGGMFIRIPSYKYKRQAGRQ
jgi:hypothetical protein